MKVLLLWYTKGDNFGDILIYQTVRDCLLDADFEVSYHEVGDKCSNIIKEANMYDFLLFAGGGIIERYVPDVIRKFEIESRNLTIPYGVIGLSIGEFDYSEYKNAISYWVNNAIFFYVRDEYSQKYLNDISGGEKVKLSTDVVFFNKALKQLNLTLGMGHGINLRDIPYPDIMEQFDWNDMKIIVREIGCDVAIPDSHEEIKKLDMRFKNDDRIALYYEMSSEKKVKEILKQIYECEWIVAMRFHVVLVSALLGIIPIPIAYCPKVKRLAIQLGLENLTLEINEYKNLYEKVKYIEENKESIKESMNNRVSILQAKVEEMFGEVISELKTINKH